MKVISAKQTTSAVRVTAQSSPSVRIKAIIQDDPDIKITIIAKGPQGRPGNNETFIGDVDLGTFN